MGNANSFDGSMCSCNSPEEPCTLDDDIHTGTLISTPDKKKNKYQSILRAHEHVHVKFLQKGRTFTYSLSSMSSSSLNSKATFSEDERRGERTCSRSRGAHLGSTQPSILDAETRNDSEQEYCQNRSEDELRVTQSSYDEATTEALSQYYSNRAAYDGRVKRVSIRNNLEREVRE